MNDIDTASFRFFLLTSDHHCFTRFLFDQSQTNKSEVRTKKLLIGTSLKENTADDQPDRMKWNEFSALTPRSD